ncbi:MAG: hypothetical protein B7Y08_13925 [Rhodospirillales bacterium 24-66-33]|nr:MAG: hypothetical protein B7Y08_13925 [Rhodospirillales bacterium 24-66-33]OZB23068.1 MAG: hypothetical protein B7X63_21070 [Rhodospirillales bacterium 39-66-50]
MLALASTNCVNVDMFGELIDREIDDCNEEGWLRAGPDVPLASMAPSVRAAIVFFIAASPLG